MAKIVVRLPEPKQEYDISNQKQINRALTTVVEQLNSTFLETQKEEQQRFKTTVPIYLNCPYLTTHGTIGFGLVPRARGLA